MKSMTGFGSCERHIGNDQLSIEVKSLNSRFLEVKVRSPKEYAFLDAHIIGEIKKIFHRGFLEVVINRQEGRVANCSKYEFYQELAAYYKRALTQAKKRLKLKGDITLDQILTLPDIWISQRKKISSQKRWDQLKPALWECFKKANWMRIQEGKTLERVILRYLKAFERQLSKIAKEKEHLVRAYESELKTRLGRFLGESRLEPQRLYQEVAYLIDRSDVSEELDRISGHAKQFHLMLKSKEVIGKNLDFLIQEMNREVNTIGSKIQDVKLTSFVIQCKSFLEKIREQVQNVE